MAKFTFTNPSSGSAYFFMETLRTSTGVYDSSSLRAAKGAYWNFTGSDQYSLVSSDYIFGWVVPPGTSSFEYNPTDYVQTGSVYFKGTGYVTAQIITELSTASFSAAQLAGTGSLNSVALENVFQATWDTSRTTTGSGTSTQLILPLMTTANGGVYDFVVNWGDNTSSSISDGAANVFNGCNSASFNDVIGVPDLGYTNSLRGIFNSCFSLSKVNNLEKWDVSGINNMRAAFYHCPLFDQNIGSWNVSNVDNFQSFLSGDVAGGSAPPAYVGSFNNGGSPSIGNWNTSKVTNFTAMFTNQISFNQNIGNWDVSRATFMSNMFQIYVNGGLPSTTSSFNNGGSDSIKNWNVSNVTNFIATFAGASSFNQPIGSWDVRKSVSMNTMFSMGINGMTFSGSFNQNIGAWNVSNVTNFVDFMASRNFTDFSSTNYDALLNGWASRPVVSGRSINFGTIKYSLAASASRAILTSAPNNWTIVDGGQIS